MAIGGNVLERLLCFVQIGYRAIKKSQACIGTRYHPGQWLFNFVGDRGSDGVASHQARLALAALGTDRADQLRIKSRYLVQQDD